MARPATGAAIDTDVTPVPGCEDLSISVSDSPKAEAEGVAIARSLYGRGGNTRSVLRPATAEEIRVDFGMTLDCSDCGWRVPLTGGALRWHSAAPPHVVSVEPRAPAARAGVQVGDVLESINDASFAGDGESPVWSALRPGQMATLRLRRGTTLARVTITPRSSRRSRL